MLMSRILLLNIPLTFYDLCVQQSRGSLVMGLSRLTMNMMGVLIFQQVVLLNDGQADSPVECSSGWVGCGMTVWAPPHSLFLLLQCSLSEWALASTVELFFPLFVQGGGPELTGIPNLHKLLPGCLLPPHLDMWGDNDRMIRAKWRRVNMFGFLAIVSTCKFS